MDDDDPFAGRPRSGPPKEWSIAIYEGPSLGELRPHVAPCLTARDVTDFDATFVADPFLFREGDSWFLFFEAMNAANRLGELAVARSDDGFAWRYLGRCLAEPFHLSYPHVFRADGETWMVPESGAARAVLLYRAVDFPLRWALEARILERVLADPTPFFHDGSWWMFGCPRAYRHDTLSLFFADALTGPWQEHPRSPLIAGDARRARPAGPVRVIDGTLIRFAQDCVPAYGSGLRAFAIDTLTRDDYAEHELTELPLPHAAGKGWNRDGVHQLDLHREGDGYIAAVDGYTLLPDSPPSIERLTDVASIEGIAAEWDLMLDVCDAHPVFSSPTWLLAACRAGVQPEVFIARRMGKITGVLPLAMMPLSDYHDVVAFDAETARVLLDESGARLRGVRENSLTFRAIGVERLAVETTCLYADLPSDFDAYLATRSHAFRKALHRAERDAARDGFEVALLDDGDAVAEIFLDLHTARFDEEGRLAAPAAASMLRAALPPLVAAGRIRPYVLRRGREIVAIDLALRSRDAIATWNGGFREEVAHLSPGRLLFAREIRDAIKLGIPRFDMLRGAHDYKASWATGSVPLYKMAT